MPYTREPRFVVRVVAKATLLVGLRQAWRTPLVDLTDRAASARLLEELFYNPGWARPSAWAAGLRWRRSRVPFRQAMAFDALVRLSTFHRSIGAETILNAGTLLGAVRQGAFAGRPGDLDVYVIHPGGVDAYIAGLVSTGSKFGIRSGRHKRTAEGPAKLKLRAPIKTDVLVLAHDPRTPGVLRPERVVDRDRPSIAWPGRASALTARVFDAPFCIPDNYEAILMSYYGDGWQSPTAHQFAERTPSLTRSNEGSR